MPWSPLFTRRKQSVIVLAQTQNALLNTLGDEALPIEFRFLSSGFLNQTGSLVTPAGSEDAQCVV